MSQVPGTAADPFGLLRDFLRGAKLMDAALRDEEFGVALWQSQLYGVLTWE